MALDFLAGCVGGCAGVLVGHPFDTIKVRIQTQDFRKPQYKGAIDCFAKTLKKESVGGLYKGMSSPMAGVAVVNAIVFGVYGNFQRNLLHPDTLSSHFLAGAAAGFVQSFVCSPMELVKTRLQLQQNTKGYTGPINCLIQVAKAEGIRGVFRGLGTTICREVPGFGTYFFAYELMTKNSGENGEPGPPISTLHMLLAGGISGSISWILTYPIDVIKSRLQVDGMAGVYKYNGFMDCLKKSIRSEGYGVLVRGLNSTILRAFPTNAATFTVVTWVIRWASANNIDDTSGYMLAEIVDVAVAESTSAQRLPNYQNGPAIKVFGLKEHLNSEENYMNNIFHWRKLMLNNCVGTNVFNNYEVISKSSQMNSPTKEENNCPVTLTNIVNEQSSFQSQLQRLEDSSSDKVADIIVSDQLPDELGTEDHHFQSQVTSESEKEPNTYQHKNDYYKSSVR